MKEKGTEKDREHRKELLTKFGDIYKRRSNAVHDGQLGKTVQFGGKPVHISKFIEEVQDLCRESIMKIWDDCGFPDWNSLIMGARRTGRQLNWRVLSESEEGTLMFGDLGATCEMIIWTEN